MALIYTTVKDWFACVACQRRKVSTCPISGQAGACPFSKAGAANGIKSKTKKAKPKELTKVEKLLQKGSELMGNEQPVYAELSYDKAIELDPKDWRAHYGKVVALKGQGKFFVAFGAARKGLEQIPGNRMLEELQEEVRVEYKNQSKLSSDRPSEETTKPSKDVVEAAAEAAAQVPPLADPSCPGSVEMPETGALLAWQGKEVSQEERKATKEMMLQVFREQWARIGKTKETMGYADYSKDLQDGLQIKGGHRPMPRPKDVLLPRDFREPVGTLTADQLAEYDCNNQRLLISLYGDIFDVSDRPDKYGKDGPYFYFSGRDITWGLVSGRDGEDEVNKFYDLFKMDEALTSKKMQCICSWIGFYEVEYGSAVGRLKEFEREEDLPAPPLQNNPECVVQ